MTSFFSFQCIIWINVYGHTCLFHPDKSWFNNYEISRFARKVMKNTAIIVSYTRYFNHWKVLFCKCANFLLNFSMWFWKFYETCSNIMALIGLCLYPFLNRCNCSSNWSMICPGQKRVFAVQTNFATCDIWACSLVLAQETGLGCLVMCNINEYFLLFDKYEFGFWNDRSPVLAQETELECWMMCNIDGDLGKKMQTLHLFMDDQFVSVKCA